MTVLSGEAAITAQRLSDKEICDKCVKTLKNLFPEEVRFIIAGSCSRAVFAAAW